MCGIVGLVDPRGVTQSQLRAMTDRIVHRGPDDEGFYVANAVGLGMRRLSIIDLAGGHQPMGNEDGSLQVVLNGEIYNYLELREELVSRGHRFTTQSDTEVIVHAYEEYGDDCVTRLWGMFALALLDVRRQRLLLARDRLGKKPLYWARWGGHFAFGSELKCLAGLAWLSHRPDPDSLETYLAVGYIPAPSTIFAGVYKLCAGEALTWESGTVKRWTYWDVPDLPAAPVSYREAVQEVRELLADAVRRRLQSDVPVGALLSGGIDSSVVVALMARQASAVETFTVGFADGEIDEAEDAGELARVLGTRHHAYVCEPQLSDIVPQIVWHLDEPVADPAAIPTFCIAQVASQHVKVVLTGEGGDEAFGGYQYYRWEALAHLYRRISAAIGQERTQRFFEQTAAVLDWPKLRRFLTCARDPEATSLSSWTRLARVGDGQSLRSPEFGPVRGDDTALRAYINAYACRPDAELLNRLLYVDLKLFLADDLLMKVDRMTMAHSLEARTPFLDHRLIERMASFPAAWKFRWFGPTKPFLREAARAWLPQAVRSRRKRIFATPMSRWLRDDLQSLIHSLFESGGGRTSGFLDNQRVMAVYRRFLAGERQFERLIWAAVVLEVWAKVWQLPTAQSAVAVREQGSPLSR